MVFFSWMDGWLVVGHGRPRRLAKLTTPPQPTVSKVKHHGDQHVSSGGAYTPTLTRTDAHMSKRKACKRHRGSSDCLVLIFLDLFRIISSHRILFILPALYYSCSQPNRLILHKPKIVAMFGFLSARKPKKKISYT